MSNPTPEGRIRLVLVYHQALVRGSLSRFLSSQAGLEMAGECATSAEALALLNSKPVDVVLLDSACGSDAGADLIAEARRGGHQGRFLIFADSADVEDFISALHCGASGVFLKSDPPDRLVQAIRLVATGSAWVDLSVIQLMAGQLAARPFKAANRAASRLTEREQEVLMRIVRGYTNRKIGDDIGLSEGTVKSVVQQLFSKTGASTRSQLARFALEISPGTPTKAADSAG